MAGRESSAIPSVVGKKSISQFGVPTAPRRARRRSTARRRLRSDAPPPRAFSRLERHRFFRVRKVARCVHAWPVYAARSLRGAAVYVLWGFLCAVVVVFVAGVLCSVLGCFTNCFRIPAGISRDRRDVLRRSSGRQDDPGIARYKQLPTGESESVGSRRTSFARRDFDRLVAFCTPTFSRIGNVLVAAVVL